MDAVKTKHYKKAKTKHAASRFGPVALSIVGAVCLAWLITWLVKLGQNITMPQIEYSEGFMLYLSQLFGTGQFTWQLGTDPPYNVAFYTPLFSILFGEIGQVFGHTLLVGRIIVLICLLVSLAVIYLIVFYITKNRLYALLGALFPLTSYLFVGWSLFARVDIPAVMFELIGLYIALRWYRTRWFWFSIPCFLLAFWTKQAVLAGAAAVFLFILWDNRRSAVIYAGIFVLALAITLGIGQSLTDGQFVKHIFLYTRTEPLIRPLKDIAAYCTVAYLPILPLIVLAFCYLLKKLKNVLSIFVLVSVVFCLILITRPGAAQNYFFEPIFALSIAAGCALPLIIQEKKKAYVVLFLVPIVFLFTINTVMIHPDAAYRDRCRQAEAVIQDATYPILTENAGIVVAAGKEPYYEPFVFNQLPRFGYWDRSRVTRDLNTKRIEYVITQFKLPFTGNIYLQEVQRFDDETQQAILANYHPVLDVSETRGYGFVIYKANK